MLFELTLPLPEYWERVFPRLTKMVTEFREAWGP